MKAGTLHTRVPMGEHGTARVVHDSPSDFERFRARRDGMPLYAETYTRLFINGETYMTDAEFECWTNAEFVKRAFGNVLIAGLGLGLIVQPLIEAVDVESITILEKNADVIALIQPLYSHPKVSVIHADVHEWEPPKKTYHLVYFDIWPNVPNSDTLKEIRNLKQKYKASLAKGGRTMAWCEDLARKGRY